MSNIPSGEPSLSDYAPPALSKTIWPLKTQCSRVEQRLLLALRSCDPKEKNHAQAERIFASLGIDAEGVKLFRHLRVVLETATWRISLFSPSAAFVGTDELDLLASLNRLSKGLVSTETSALDANLNPLQPALRQCACVIRRAGLTLRQRTLVMSGRRVLEHETVDARQKASRNLRAVKVCMVRQLSPHLRRITIEGADMSGFLEGAPAQWVKMFAPGPDGGRGDVGRAYTIRRYRAELNEVDIDCVLHDSGPMSRWAAAAEVGQVAYLSGVRGGYTMSEGISWLLLAGDTSALPAIGAILESMPGDVDAHVFLEVEAEEDLKVLPMQSRVNLRWGIRNNGVPASESTLVRLLRTSSLPRGQGRTWMAGEATVARAVRNHLLIDRLIPAKHIYSVGYWKRGEQDHRDMAAD